MRNPAGAALIFSLVFGLFGTLTLAIDIGRPFPGYLSLGFIGRPEVYVNQETPWWFPDWQEAGLKVGDVLIAINGLPYPQYARAEIARAYETGEPFEVLARHEDADELFTTSLYARKFTLFDFADIKFPELVTWVGFWLLGIIVLRSRPDSPVNRVFTAVVALIALHRLAAVISVSLPDLWWQDLPSVAHRLAAGLIPPLIFHIAFLFPVPLRRKPIWTLRILYGLGALSGGILAAARLPFWARVPVELNIFLDYYAYRLMMVLFAASVLMLFGRLVGVWYIKRNDRRVRRIVTIILTGLIMALPPVIVIAAPVIPAIGRGMSPFWQGLDLRYLLMMIPISFALAIIRYRAFQNPSRLFMFVLIIAISALIASVAVAVWSAVSLKHVSPGSPNLQILFFVALIAGSFWSLQASWQGGFGRLLHRDQLNYSSVWTFGDRIMSRSHRRSMPNLIAQALVEELSLERAAVWLWDENDGVYELAGSADNGDPPLPQRLTPAPGSSPINQAMHVKWAIAPAWLGVLAGANRIEFVNRMAVEGRTIGLLGLGRRWDEDIFDERDLAVVELVTQQAALFMQTSMQIEELRRVPARVAAAQEQERFRLAGELHDTIQQFLGRLPFFLAASRNLIAGDPVQAAAILDRSMADVEEAAAELREIRANLAPNQLTNSLVKPLRALADHIEKRHDLIVHLDAPRTVDEATTIGTRHALYRVIQQATDNVATHADGATTIAIMLRRVGARIYFSVTDDGSGVGRAALEQAADRGGFGLQSMRARVEAVGGEFVFSTTEGHGTTVSGWIPSAKPAEKA